METAASSAASAGLIDILSSPLALSSSITLALQLVFILLMVCQTLNIILFTLYRSRGSHVVLWAHFEAGLLLFFLSCEACLYCISKNDITPQLKMLGFVFNLMPLTSINILIAVICIITAIRSHTPQALPTALCPLVLTPFTFYPESTLWGGLFITISLFCVGRTIFRTAQTWFTRPDYLSRFALTEAVGKIPEGIACYDENGAFLLMNNAMRQYLQECNLPLDIANANEIEQRVAEIAQQQALEGLEYSNGMRVQSPAGRSLLFVQGPLALNGANYRLVTAMDISEEEELLLELAQTNHELKRTQAQLQSSLENVQEVAENDALLYLQSRVHDTIGQRLSILHRYLEDGDFSEESFAKIHPLLQDILSDLEKDRKTDAASDLFAIVNAFALIGVEVHVMGNLPDDSQVADAFVQIIREACTNAVKHAQASLVSVTIAQTGNRSTLTINNNGAPFTGELKQGTGLPGMARAIIALGGEISLQTQPTFTIFAAVAHAGAQEEETDD